MSGFIDICVKTKEWDKLADHISSIDHEQLEELSHYTTERAAIGLAKKHNMIAAQIYSALGMRILKKGKSKLRNISCQEDCRYLDHEEYQQETRKQKELNAILAEVPHSQNDDIFINEKVY